MLCPISLREAGQVARLIIILLIHGLEQTVHLLPTLDLLMNSIDYRALKLLNAILDIDLSFWAFNQALNLSLQSLKSMVFDNPDCVKMCLTRLRGHPIELGLLLVFVEELASLSDVSPTLNVRCNLTSSSK